MEDLIKALRADFLNNESVSTKNLKIQNLDPIIIRCRSTSNNFSVWEMIGWYDKKIKIPRKKKKNMDYLSQVAYTEGYRIKKLSKFEEFDIQMYIDFLKNICSSRNNKKERLSFVLGKWNV